MLEAFGFDFAGKVVVPEISPVAHIPLREQHLRDRVHVPPVPAPLAPRDPEPASSDRSSVVARLRQRVNEL